MKSARSNMRGPTYRYNEVTCRYERSGRSATGVFSYVSGLLLTTSVVFAGMLMLHDYLVDTPNEKALRKENAAIQKHQVILKGQLGDINLKLEELREKDASLHNKFFASVSNLSVTNEKQQIQNNLLVADAESFIETVNNMKETSDHLMEESSEKNSDFSKHITLKKGKLDALASMPFHNPINNLTPDKLISGFGMRIHPFHKGLYEHPGIDIALPRGTEVWATALGKVLTVKRSTLQAGYGNYVEIDHGNGFVTRYAHLEEIKVRVGEKVNTNTIIATSGNSGGSAAPHLHYEILRDGKNVDPVLYMISGVSTSLHEQFTTASQKENQSLD